jgi:5-methylcytosine-specific restriction endonuclease McrA
VKNGNKTPRSVIKAALRLIWLRSRERQAALRRDDYCCRICGRQRSKAKDKPVSVEVHHMGGIIDWDAIIDVIYEKLLMNEEHLVALCDGCHDKGVREAKV